MVLKYIFCLSICWLPSILGAQNYFKTSAFDTQDTVFLVKDFGGNFKTKITIWDSISLLHTLNFFKVGVTEFQQSGIQFPSELFFPFPKELINRYKDETFDTSPHIPICYIAEKGDTYYAIARKLFGIPLITLLRRNQIENEELTIGKPLLVGWYALRDSIKEPENRDFQKPVFLGDIKQIKKQYEVENGIAIKEGKHGPTNQNLALSNDYPLGTKVLIYNPVTGLALKIEIVGKIPLTLYNKSVSFVIGEDIASKIGVKDKKFHIGILRKK
jgi:hypothetical protein